MALIRWEPVRELQTVQNEMNRLFNSFFDSPAPRGNGGAALRRWIPAMDVVETDDHFVLRADLPGMSESDVKIELDDNVLTISGERKSEHEQRSEGYYRVERASGSFSRSLTLPEGVDADDIQAELRQRRARGPDPEARAARSRARSRSRSAAPPRRSRAPRRPRAPTKAGAGRLTTRSPSHWVSVPAGARYGRAGRGRPGGGTWPSRVRRDMFTVRTRESRFACPHGHASSIPWRRSHARVRAAGHQGRGQDPRAARRRRARL